MRQGGIFSPILFCVYMDILLNSWKLLGLDVGSEDSFSGAMSYADDLKLLSPIIKGLKAMLEICEKFGYTYGVNINSQKTVCILY